MPTARRGGLVVAVLAGAGIVVSLMQTLLVPILPQLPALLHTSEANASWAVTATVLAAAVATPVLGRLGDMYGKRRILLASAVLMVAGSLVCALTSSLVPMIAGRALQGLSAAVIPLGISIMRDVLPREKLSSSIAMMSASLGVGGAIGLPVSALIAQHADWHALFWVSVALGAVITAAVPLVVPESSSRAGGRLDVPGVAGLAAGLVALLVAITEGGTWGWTDARTLACLAGSVVVLLGWGAWELRTAAPLADLRTNARPQVLITNLASVVVGFGMYASSLIAPQILEMPAATGYGLGQSMVAAGLWMLPMGLVMMALSPVAGRLIGRYGAKVPMLAGAVVIAVGYGLSVVLMHHAWGVMTGGAVLGAGVGLAYAAMPSLIMGAVPASETAAANGLNSLMRAIGTSLASAVIGAILAHMTTHLGGAVIPSEGGFRTGLLIGGAGALLAALVVLAIPRQRPGALAQAPAGEQVLDTGYEPAERVVPAAGEAAVNGTGPESATAGAPGATVPQTIAIGSPLAPSPDGLASAPVAMANGAGPGGPAVSGYVRNGAGVPLPGAAVTLIDPAGRQAGIGRSDSDGRYQVPVSGQGTYTIIAMASAHEPFASAVRVADRPAKLDVRLSGTSTLTGVIRAAGSGQPLPGVTATLAGARGEVLGTAVTSEGGQYAIENLVAGQYTLALAAPSCQPVALPVAVSDDEETTLDAELRSGARVEGTARNTAGAAVPDARVTLLDPDGNVAGVATAGPGGGYAFENLPEGEYTVIASGYPSVSSSLKIAGSDPHTHDVELGHPES